MCKNFLGPPKSDVQVCYHNPLSRLGLPLVPCEWDMLVDALGYPTFLHVFGTDETVLWNPMCTAAQANPMCPSYPTVLYMYRWDSPMESHVFHCTGQSYVSVLSHSPMWDRWDSPMKSHVYHCSDSSFILHVTKYIQCTV